MLSLACRICSHLNQLIVIILAKLLGLVSDAVEYRLETAARIDLAEIHLVRIRIYIFEVASAGSHAEGSSCTEHYFLYCIHIS